MNHVCYICGSPRVDLNLKLYTILSLEDDVSHAICNRAAALTSPISCSRLQETFDVFCSHVWLSHVIRSVTLLLAIRMLSVWLLFPVYAALNLHPLIMFIHNHFANLNYIFKCVIKFIIKIMAITKLNWSSQLACPIIAVGLKLLSMHSVALQKLDSLY